MRQRTVLPTPYDDLEIVITDDGSRTLRVKGTEITFHSESGALAESELVFLDNSAVGDRLLNGLSTRVLEIGLGTGLNFWITASQAFRHATPLSYLTAETQLMSMELVELLQHGLLDSCQPAFDRFAFSIFQHQADLVRIEPVTFERIKTFASLRGQPPETVDAIYHDPFSPEVAPELWTNEMFAELRAWLKPSGRLVTYCVKSSIQRALKSAGYRIEKTRGPVGGKREVLIAINDP